MSSKLDEACRTNQKIRASFILYEFRYGKSIFKCYNDFREKMGPNFMDYLEFEFWWMRFSAGNFDIEYDRSKGPKYRTITDLPVDIFENICENLGDNYQNKYRFIFRHVCKSFRALADSWIPKFEKVSIEAHFTSSVDLYFDGKKFHYKNEKKALSDLISVIAHPKFDNFGIDSIMIINPAFLMRLVKELESRKLKIQVHYVYISSYYPDWKNQMLLFPFYQAETVKMVYIKERQEQILEFIEEICELDQEERAGDDGIPENAILKPKSIMFSRMDIALRYLGTREATTIIKNLLHFSNLECWHLHAELSSASQVIENIETYGAKIQADDPMIFHYPIPNSSEFLKIHIRDDGIYMERKSA
ncbi:hypothetical protein B9Z55_026968 [Caenorhabditis nigoni]|uniref:Mos1 transposase HTH domain-containing protein n=1 Tax=Caenorhabditis nigoni TaxID=1611254 RepID=A0A2G5SIN1_9PELO|nr:hypothetical protein B9Z55_026968 [Caenorhabditis nigoni]